MSHTSVDGEDDGGEEGSEDSNPSIFDDDPRPVPLPPEPDDTSSGALPAICKFGKYELLGRLAGGGMADIFLARERSDAGGSRRVAIKRMRAEAADDPEFIRMFTTEARLVMGLSHPHICHLYEFGQEGGQYYIAMEWVRGVSLSEIIPAARKQQGIPIAVTVKIFSDIAEALHFAHRAKDGDERALGIVHRDVSPSNIMVSYDGVVKLLDFGIAKAMTQVVKTRAGVVKGKFSYMSPQQCQGEDVDHRSDVFSLGVCLYEALTLERLFRRKTDFGTMIAVSEEPVPSLRSIRPDIPRALDVIVHKALAKDPDERYQSAGEMQEAMLSWLAESRQYVNAARVSAFMESLFSERIARGPILDRSLASWFPRPADPDDVTVAAKPEPETEVDRPHRAEREPPARSSPWAWLLVTMLLAGGFGAGLVRWGPWRAPIPITPNAASTVAHRPESVSDPVPEAPDSIAVPPPVTTTGSLSITTIPPGASVRLDDREVEGVTPLTVENLEAGPLSVTLERRGHRRGSLEVEIRAGELVPIEATLEPVQVRPAAPPGHLSINTRPWSRIYIGNRLLGTTPIARTSVPSGRVRLRIVDREGNTHRRVVDLPAGGHERLFYDLGEE